MIFSMVYHKQNNNNSIQGCCNFPPTTIMGGLQLRMMFLIHFFPGLKKMSITFIKKKTAND